MIAAEPGAAGALYDVVENLIEFAAPPPPGSDDELGTQVAILIVDDENVRPGDDRVIEGLVEELGSTGMVVHTIGVGPDAPVFGLGLIAEGTGGTYTQTNDPDDLGQLYEDLGQQALDNVDTDNDGLSDCEEREGVFAPDLFSVVVDGIFGNGSTADIYFTDPNDPDSDGDTIADGTELQRRTLSDNPTLATEYEALIDAGYDTYFWVASNPAERDTDGDTIDDNDEPFYGTNPRLFDTDRDGDSDGLEVNNGTDPLYRNGIYRFGTDLDLPPSTLFEPNIGPNVFSSEPSLNSYLGIVDGKVTRQFFAPAAVKYSLANNDCAINCDAIDALADQWTNDNDGLFPCFGGLGNCLSDLGQRQLIVNTIVASQGIFDADGLVRPEFIARQGYLFCIANHSFPDECVESTILQELVSTGVPEYSPAYAGAGIAAAQRTMSRESDFVFNDDVLVFYGLIMTADDVVSSLAARRNSKELARACVAAAGARLAQQLLLNEGIEHVCALLPVFANGADTPTLTPFKIAAISGGTVDLAGPTGGTFLEARPSHGLLTYSPEAEVEPRLTREWYNSQTQCNPDARVAYRIAYPESVGSRTLVGSCDEMPHYTTTTSGRSANSGAPAHLLLLPKTENSSEGSRLGNFQDRCRNVSAPSVGDRAPYIMAPSMELPTTVWTCGNGGEVILG